MQRRDFFPQLTGALLGSLVLTRAPAEAGTAQPPYGRFDDLEPPSGGRLGVAVLDTALGRWQGHRLDERFPMCSTFKWLAAAAVLRRVDRGEDALDMPVDIRRQDLVPYSPTTEPKAGSRLSVGALCEAAVTLSDNTAGNLLLKRLDGPAGLTRHARDLGDRVTRLDRWEPQLNEATPGDPRDTTSPRAMAGLLQAAVLGGALSAGGQAQLTAWLEACSTNGERLKAQLPAGWRLGSKTGTGQHGSCNDVGVFWPPGRPPVIAAVYITDSAAPLAARNAVIGEVARRITQA